jgi:hypothetical protein
MTQGVLAFALYKELVVVVAHPAGDIPQQKLLVMLPPLVLEPVGLEGGKDLIVVDGLDPEVLLGSFLAVDSILLDVFARLRVGIHVTVVSRVFWGLCVLG